VKTKAETFKLLNGEDFVTEGNQSAACACAKRWRELYKAALFETDRHKLPSRIAEAEKALILRERELFATYGGSSDEGQAVDQALYALRALRRYVVQLKPDEPRAS
jgi:hypothetical protein